MKYPLINVKPSFCYVLFLLFTLGCSKNDDEPSIDEAFSDLADFTTTGIETTIPRVEISQSGNALKVLLSVTDQDGVPLEKFTLGNYEIEMTVGGNSETVAKNRISMTALDGQSNSNPLAAATTLDYSGSMSSQERADMEVALKTFIDLKGSNDRLSIIKFGSRVEQVQPFTTDPALLNTAIDAQTSVGGSTAFYSACELGLDEVDKLTGVLPVVIGFTDGGDNRSSISLADLTAKALAMGIPIYAVGFGSAERSNLKTLADDTGGRFFFAPDSQDIAELYSVISGQLKKLYIFEWENDLSPGTEVTVRITTEYTTGNGTFSDVSTKILNIQ